MRIANTVKHYYWLFQKFSRIIFSKFSGPNKVIQLNQFIENDLQDLRVVKYSEELIGRKNYKQASEYRAIFHLRYPSLNPKSGVVWMRTMLVAESSIWHPAELRKFEPRPLLPEYLNESVAVLPDNGYFHFLTEELPRYLEVTDYFPNLLSVYSSDSSKYVYEALRAAGATSKAFNCPIRVKELFLSEKLRGGMMTEQDLAGLRAFQARLLSTKPAGKKIFVYRSDSADSPQYYQRGLDRQKEIMSQLVKEGFQIVRLENLTFQDQIRLFSETRHIAGFHGAGLANQIWMPTGGKVTEFVSLRKTHHFSHLAQLAGHDYTENLIV